MKVGFIGLGQMGAHMARNLAKAGHDVAVYDVRPEAAAKLAETPGIRAASSIADAAKDAEVVGTSLPAPKDVESVVMGPGGLRESMKVWVDLR